MYINANTKGTFILHADIRYEMWKEGKEAPGVLTDEFLAENGYHLIEKVEQPFDPITQKLDPFPPELENGKWVQKHKVVALDAATIANNQNIAEVMRTSGIRAQLEAIDRKSIRAIREGDQARIDALEAEAVKLRSQL